jgi:hypothetical protein
MKHSDAVRSGKVPVKAFLVLPFQSLTVHVSVVQLLLGYLPNDRSLWEGELAKKRSQYAAFKDEFLSNPVSHHKFGLWSVVAQTFDRRISNAIVKQKS